MGFMSSDRKPHLGVGQLWKFEFSYGFGFSDPKTGVLFSGLVLPLKYGKVHVIRILSHCLHEIQSVIYISRYKITVQDLKRCASVLLGEMNSENSMKIVKLRYFSTTESFGFMNLTQLEFKL